MKQTLLTLDDLFSDVETALEYATLVAYDGCHKMYLAMDDEQADWFRQNYEYTVEGSPSVMLKALHEWWKDSCSLRFVQSVKTTPNPNDGFVSLIEQGWGQSDDDDELWTDGSEDWGW